MAVILPSRKSLVIGLAALATIGLATAPAVAQDKPEQGVKIEFWQGHFNHNDLPFHYWDKEKAIPPVCARCHGAMSVPQYLKEGKVGPAAHVKNGFACTNCHADMLTYARYPVPKVHFPSGVTVDSGNNDTNLCMTCHQGHAAGADVDKATAGMPLDKVNPKLNFIHVHFFGAGATIYGGEAKVGYQYAGKKYVGRFAHMPNVSNCVSCHQPHTGEVKIDRCGGCHAGVNKLADLVNIRMETKGDFDGNGKEEGLAKEIVGLQNELYAAIQTYAKNVGGVPIVYTEEEYPHWYADKNGNGRADPEEIVMANKYPAYTPRLLQAVYNYTYAKRDPGGAYHNGRYVLELLYDSLDSLAQSGKAGVKMAGKVRP